MELLDKSSSTVNHTSLSNYAFLYGVFPAAPGVAIFATQFNMEVGIVCSQFFSKLVLTLGLSLLSKYLCNISTYGRVSNKYFSEEQTL